jgi:hypothetical protein
MQCDGSRLRDQRLTRPTLALLALVAACGKAKAGDSLEAGAATTAAPSSSTSAAIAGVDAAAAMQPAGDLAAAHATSSAGSSATPTDVSYEGTYRSGENAIKLLRVDATHAKFDVYAQNSHFNTGYATGDATVDKSGATYTDNSMGHCTIRMDFAPGSKLNVTQQG